jgi:hypothetical protein
MKNSILILLTNVIIGFAFAQSTNFIEQPYIEVAGYADTLVAPNQIFIGINLSEKDSKEKLSLEELENKLIKALKELNINVEKNLSTSTYLSMYQFYLFKSKDIIKSKEYTLKVYDIQTVNKVFLKLEELGISNSSIQNVGHSDYELIKNICRKKAIKNARVKALLLTNEISQTIGNAIHIIENEIKMENIDEQILRIRGNNSMNYMQSQANSNEIEFDKIKISASIHVKFSIK